MYDLLFRQINDYAGAHGFQAGFPTFHSANYGTGFVSGNFLLRNTVAEWHEVLRDDLGVFHIEDVPAMFRAVNDWASRQGHQAAFPNFHQADHGGRVVCGVIVLKPGVTEWHEVLRDDLGVFQIEDVPAMFRAVNDWAVRQGHQAAFPNFHQADHGGTVVCGVFSFKSGTAEFRDIYADILKMFTRFTFAAEITDAQRERLLERHSFAYSRIHTCGTLNPEEKGKLVEAYQRPIHHDITTNPKANASAPLGGSKISVNFNILFPKGNAEIAQTLIHEMVHCAGYTHPDRRDPDPANPSAPVDRPGDNGPYFGTPPLRAEICIAGSQSLTSAEAATECRNEGGEFIIRPKQLRPTERSWEDIGHANKVVTMAAITNKLFCATRDNRLWWRDPVGRDVPWEPIGHANDVVAMAAITNKLFCATRDNRLWWRDPVGRDVPWEPIGHANDVVAMAAITNKLFCATRDNRLWWRDPVGRDVPWEPIGHANDVVAMAATTNKLFCATRDNRLWWRDPVGRDVPWEPIGHANDVVAMAATDAKLFCATRDDRLWWRDPIGGI